MPCSPTQTTTMSDNRLEALAAFLAANPDLPEGQDAPAPEPRAGRLPRLSVSIERKGRAGKTATIVAGFASPEQAAEAAEALRKRLATGGSARGCEVLLQGERREQAAEALRAMGYRV